ncbi:hypothetical protein HID58_082543, partial [Brassica napus]
REEGLKRIATINLTPLSFSSIRLLSRISFFDSMGQLWKEQTVAGKPAGFFVSTGTQGGGQETTAWTAITQLVHHGMLIVPIGYTFGAGMFKMDSIHGGSPYGAALRITKQKLNLQKGILFFSGVRKKKTKVMLATWGFHTATGHRPHASDLP